MSWRVRIRRRGFPTITRTFRYKADADRWAAKAETQISDGDLQIIQRKKQRTLADAIDRYLGEEAPALRDYRNRLRQLNWWRRAIGTQTLYSLVMDRDLIYDAIRQLKTEESLSPGQRRGPATVKRYIAALSKLFSSAVNWGWIDTNPVRHIQKPTEPAGRTRFLSDTERQKLLTALAASRDPYLHTVVLMALCTGARYGELMNLAWADISFDRSTVTFRQTKNGDSRTCPLTGEVLSRLRVLNKVRHIGSSWVFPRFDGAKPKCIQSAWRRVLAQAGIEDFRFHDLRHTAASYLAMSGATPTELSAILGHKTLAMVARYAHVSEQHTADLIQRMTHKYLT